jgi:hypothetical protein
VQAFNAESAADLICRVPRITPDDARHPYREWKTFCHLSSARLSPADPGDAAGAKPHERLSALDEEVSRLDAAPDWVQAQIIMLWLQRLPRPSSRRTA